MTAIWNLLARSFTRHGAGLAVGFAILAASLLAYVQITHTAKRSRADAVALGMARAEIEALIKQIDLRVSIIERLQADAQRRVVEQQALSKTQNAVVKHRDTVRQQQRRLNEDTTVRSWGSTPLPDDVARLHNSPALTGAVDYLQHLPSPQPVHDASHGATN
ncbi:LysB family phage lysis regulatory protein [Robbsia andropogonis]|uniref:Rz-like lysis system protein LysB n=1 Tax=Robbsia andropogonis TaxID=28092 RepID=UPI003D1DB023